MPSQQQQGQLQKQHSVDTGSYIKTNKSIHANKWDKYIHMY
jgi:hypothetical protein